MAFEDLKENKTEAATKAAGKLRQQGKPYESEPLFSSACSLLNLGPVVDGDIAYWKAGA